MKRLIVAAAVAWAMTMAVVGVLASASGAAASVSWLTRAVGEAPMYIGLGVFIGITATVACQCAWRR